MGLAITNNVSSLTAANNLNRTASMLSKSLERLSSGLKINRGADGPAALVISEQQRAQIAGLQTAIDNTSKAISMVQTTEGALNEVNSLLVKIRSLALDSANSGVNDSNALAANQAEISNALDTINRIANNTQFGSKKLLDGSLGTTITGNDVVNAAIESQVTTGLSSVNLAAGDYNLKITTAFVPAVTGVAASSASAVNVTAGAAGTFFDDGSDTAAASTSAINVTGGTAATFFNDTASGGGADVDAAAVVNASYFTDVGNVDVGGITYAYDATTQVSDVIAAVNADTNNDFTISLSDATHQFTVTAKVTGTAGNGTQVTITGATNTGTLTATAGGTNAANINANAVTNASYFTESGNVVVGGITYAYDNTTQVSDVITAVNADTNNRFTISLSDATHQFTVLAKNTGTIDNGSSVSILGAIHQGNLTATAGGVTAVARVDAAGELTNSTGASLSPMIVLTARPLSDGTVLENTALGIQFDVDNTAATTIGDKGTVFNVVSSSGGAVFQIGANAGQTATLSVTSVAATNLGAGIVGNLFANLNTINVTTSAGAQDALAVIDQAINEISDQRGTLGAFQQNTLESMANNLRSTLANTVAAESVIRDTDFASETANFTKYQVLMQVGTTVLANSNNIGQLVLGLLRQ